MFKLWNEGKCAAHGQKILGVEDIAAAMSGLSVRSKKVTNVQLISFSLTLNLLPFHHVRILRIFLINTNWIWSTESFTASGWIRGGSQFNFGFAQCHQGDYHFASKSTWIMNNIVCRYPPRWHRFCASRSFSTWLSTKSAFLPCRRTWRTRRALAALVSLALLRDCGAGVARNKCLVVAINSTKQIFFCFFILFIWLVFGFQTNTIYFSRVYLVMI